jgi:hypothetical protein
LFDEFWARLQRNKNKTVCDTPEPHKLDFFLACAVCLVTESEEYRKSCPNSFGEQITKSNPLLGEDLRAFKRHPLAEWANNFYRDHRRTPDKKAN